VAARIIGLGILAYVAKPRRIILALPQSR